MHSVENGFDFIHIYNASGVEILGSPFTGTEFAGTTLTIHGDTIQVRLTSDIRISAWGFEVTSAVASAGSILSGSTGGSGDGCISNPFASFNPAVILLLLFSLIYLVRKEKVRTRS